MKIRYIVWLDYVKDKLLWKHHVQTEEVVEVFHNKPRFFKKNRERLKASIFTTLWDGQMKVDIYPFSLFINRIMMR